MTTYQIEQDDLDDLNALLHGICEYVEQEPDPRRASELGDLTSTIHEILTQVVQAGAVKGASAQGQAH